MSDRRLVITECDATSADKGKLFALDPGKAAGIALPAFDLGGGLPPSGSVIGQGFFDKLHRRGFVWDGTAWKDIAPSPIVAFATQAALVADTTNAVGTYATAGDTGNLFVKQTAGWRMIGVVQYATATDLLADNPAKGTLGEAEDEDTLWERTATGWRLLVVREMADTAAILAWANGSPGATVGDRAIDLAHEVTYIRTTGGWKPSMIWEETEANIRAATWALNGQEAIATDTGRTFIRTGGKWVEEPIQHFATDALLKAATPADGTLAWADDTAAVYARAAGKWVGMNTGFSDPLPIGAINAFPTHTMPAGWLLCDGSAIPAGKDYDELRTILGTTTVPNLLGQFLRGSSTATDALLAKISWTTARPHQGFTGLTNENGAHVHDVGIRGTVDVNTGIDTSFGTTHVGSNKPFSNYAGDLDTFHPKTNSTGAHSHTVTINGGGDTETAPDHVRICWGIKARYATVMPATALVVNTSTPKAGDVLTYDVATSTWRNQPSGGGSITGLVTMPAANKWFRLFIGVPDASGLYRIEMEPGDNGAGGAVTFELLQVKGTTDRFKLLEAWPTSAGQMQNIDIVGLLWHTDGTVEIKAHTTTLAGQPGRPLRVTARALDGADVSGFVFGGGDDTAPPPEEQLAVPELFPDVMPAITVSGTAPATPKLGQEWFDTTNKVLMVCTQATPSVVWTPASTSYPKLVGNRTIEHHMFNADQWEESTVVVTNVQTYVPAGNLYKLEADLRMRCFHGGTGRLRTYFTGPALFGSTDALGNMSTEADSLHSSSPGHTRTAVGLSVAGTLSLHILTQGSGGGNGDRQVFGQMLLWDLGPDAPLPTLA